MLHAKYIARQVPLLELHVLRIVQSEQREPRDPHLESLRKNGRLARVGRRSCFFAGGVLKITAGGVFITAPTVTANLVSCVFTTPHHQGKASPVKRARIRKIAWSPLKPSATISKPRQLGVPLDLCTSPACDANPNSPQRQINHFCTFSLALSRPPRLHTIRYIGSRAAYLCFHPSPSTPVSPPSTARPFSIHRSHIRRRKNRRNLYAPLGRVLFLFHHQPHCFPSLGRASRREILVLLTFFFFPPSHLSTFYHTLIEYRDDPLRSLDLLCAIPLSLIAHCSFPICAVDSRNTLENLTRLLAVHRHHHHPITIHNGFSASTTGGPAPRRTNGRRCDKAASRGSLQGTSPSHIHTIAC